MTQRRILVVDDEMINREIIRECIAALDDEIDLATCAEEAWAHLVADGKGFDVVILDRMMPGMNGIDLLRRMKGDGRFRAIPVIMQTAANSPEEMREGIAAGAFYYLTKPYDPATLLAIVRAALDDSEELQWATRHATGHHGPADLPVHAEYRIRTLDDIGPLIEVLAGMCPAPESAAPGLTELLVNAVEHGSLGISYADKKRLRLDNAWEDEIVRRQALPEYRERIVRVRVDRHPGRIEFTITDQGAGFDWQRYLDFDPERATDPNGRGIAMARMMSFASVQYRGCGNTVVATIGLLPSAADTSS